MKIEYKLSEENMLVCLLFVNDKNEKQIKKIKWSRYIVPIGFLVYACMAEYLNKDRTAAIFFLSAGLLCFFLTPIWQRYKLLKLFRKMAKENYRSGIEHKTELVINDDEVQLINSLSQTNLPFNSLESVDEIQSLIIIYIKDETLIVIPKDQISEVFIGGLKSVAAQKGIEYNEKLDWTFNGKYS